MADDQQLEILRKGVLVWNRWRETNRPIVDLSDADLSKIELGSVDVFNHAELHLSDLHGTNLVNADLGGATLVNSDLCDANLQGASLAGADLWGAELRNANLRDSVLYDTDFTEADLDGTDFTNAFMDGTIFSRVDLSKAKGLDAVIHEGPCRIDVDTLYRSGDKLPRQFLVGAGVPDSFITYLTSLVANPIEYYSCFISYSSKDQDFASLLHSQLQSKGARVWLATEDLKIGDRFRVKIDEAIRMFDKLVLVLSDNSIESPWVESEVEAAFEKERKQKRTVLFPIRLDDAVMTTEKVWAGELRRTRHIGDFRGWKDPDQYQIAFDRLLRDLQATEPAPEGRPKSPPPKIDPVALTAPKATPNLRVEGTKAGKIIYEGGVWTFKNAIKEHPKRYRALVADISNVPADGMLGAKASVVAAIRMEYGGRQWTYSPLPWLDEWNNLVYLETGARKTVVLAVGEDNKTGAWTFVLNHRKDYSGTAAISDIDWTNLCPSKSDLPLEILLIDMNTGAILEKFVYVWTFDVAQNWPMLKPVD
jgi:hypothetical protein